MEEPGFLLRGLVLGFSIAAPVARARAWVNRVSGATICAFGVLALAGLAGSEG
ncbi:MAG: hypothetical protein ACRENJ_01150 [Candidatus Eiseniibacteriota bacterium]